MKWYPWLYPHLKQLIYNYHSGRAHHALLVQTTHGMGDDKLIHAIICFLMCQDLGKSISCGECRSCQLMQANTHPDCYVLSSKDSGNCLGIENIRDINEKLYKYASMGGAKIVWIKDVSLLTEGATNSLLKILENPPEKTWFFFSYYQSKCLLTTLRSRCLLYRLTAPKEELSLSWIQKKVRTSQNIALTALRLCCGAPIAALELLQENNWRKRNDIYSALSNALKNRNWFSMLKLLNHDQVTVYLQWIIALLLDILKIQQGATIITNIDIYFLVSDLAKLIDNSALHIIVGSLCKCRQQLLTMKVLNRELILANQLLAIEDCLQPNNVSPYFNF